MVAFQDPQHPDHNQAVQLDGYRKSITDLLNTAAAQLTTFWMKYPRYVRLSLVQRLQQRFIGWDPVDQKRMNALEGKEYERWCENNGTAVAKAKTANTLKEKQRKKALEKRKLQSKKTTYTPEPWNRSKISDDYNISSSHNNLDSSEGSEKPTKTQTLATKDVVGHFCYREPPKTPVRSTLPPVLTCPRALKSTMEVDSCDQSVDSSLPRSSIASVWTPQEQSTSTSDTSPRSSEKDPSQLNNTLVYLETPIKAARATIAESLELPLPFEDNKETATTMREEVMYAHIIRIARCTKGLEVALCMTALLPKRRQLPAPVDVKEAKIDTKTQTGQIAAKPPKTAKEKREARTKKDKAETQYARDLDFADDLLYSALKEGVPSTPVNEEPVTAHVTPADDGGVQRELDTMSCTSPRGRHFDKPR